MTDFAPYLAIAGIAHRQVQELKKKIADDRHCFPNGDLPLPANEVACCEAIVALVQAVLALQLRVLEFSPEGKAIARIPPISPTLLELMDDEEPQIFEP